MENVHYIIGALIILSLCIILILYFMKSKNKKDNSNIDSSNENNIKYLKLKINELKQECYKLYCQHKQIYEENINIIESFSGLNGITKYTQRLLGFTRYDIDNFQNTKDIELVYNTITQKGLLTQIQKISEHKEPTYLKEDKYTNIELNADISNINDYNKLLELQSRLTNFIQEKRNNITIENNNQTIIIYKKIYNKLYNIQQENEINTIISTNQEQDLIKAIIKFTKNTEQIFTNNGFEFIYYEEAKDTEKKKNLFKILEHADNLPAVLLNNEVIFIGQYTKQ